MTFSRSARLLLAALVSLSASAAWAGPVSLSGQMSLLQQVNSHVNGTIQEVTDLEQYGREDVWTLPTSGKGDCEDFALLKRQMLVQRGVPASALSVIVGTSAQGEAHAVLQVSTDQGPYVLDNQRSSVVSLAESGFRTLSRQTANGFASASTGETTSTPTADFVIGPARTAARARTVTASARRG